MADQMTSNRVRGKTLRWTLGEGPQAGRTFEHTFHLDGTVEYRAIEEELEDHTSTSDAGRGDERPTYAVYRVADDVDLVSYRAGTGFTLTVALNFADHRLVSIASNSELWFPARGTFAEVDG